MSRRIGKLAVALALTSTFAAGVSQLMADRGGCRPVGPRCICPAVFDPVTCDRGCTYTNACFAACAGATGCGTEF